MQEKQISQYMAFFFLTILIGAGLAGGINNQPIGNDLNQVEKQTIVFEDGNSVDIYVDGNITTLIFSDGAMVVVNVTAGLSIIEFWENLEANNFTRITIRQQEQLLPYPSPFQNEIPATSTSVNFEFVETSSSKILSSWKIISAPSFNDSYPSVTQISGMTNDENSTRTFETQIANNATHTGMDLNVQDSNNLDEQARIAIEMLASFPRNMTIQLYNRNGTDSVSSNVTAGQRDITPQTDIESFFDQLLTTNSSGKTQEHEINGKTNPFGSTSTYNNVTSGTSDTQVVEPGQPPLPLRYPSPTSPDDPTKPYDILDIILKAEAIFVEFGGFSIALYQDKLVLNYLTWTGTYIPIIVLFEVWEVYISVFEISIVVFLQVVELVMVIMVYEIIKIEVYVFYTVIVIEVLQITLIEITIIHIDIDVIVINIDITVNVWIFKIVIKVVKKVIVFIPLWIMIIPVFIPVPVPVFVPVPTPVPVPVLQTDVDLYNQSIDEASKTMNLTYFVSDEYGNPLSGAAVSLTMSTRSGTIYNATEITGMPGYYQFTDIPLDSPTTITVTADFGVSYRPVGILTHSFSLSGVTVLVPSNVTQTQTTTQIVPTTVTVTTNGSQGTITSSTPISGWLVLSSVAIMAILASSRMKKKHQK